MDAITEHLSVIRTLFDAAESRDLLLWLESGRAIDARLGRITREHEDIDIAFAKEEEAISLEILETLGFDRHEEMDYWFLSWRDAVLLDSEPCFISDIPQEQWRDKDFESLQHIEAHLDEDKKRSLKELYARAM